MANTLVVTLLYCIGTVADIISPSNADFSTVIAVTSDRA
jgi:hypothetical protein